MYTKDSMLINSIAIQKGYQPIQNIYFRLCRNHTFSIASKLCKSIIQYTY